MFGCPGRVALGQPEAVERDQLRHALGPGGGIDARNISAEAVADERNGVRPADVREKPIEIRHKSGEGTPAGSPAAQTVAAQVWPDDVPLARQGINDELEGGRGIESANGSLPEAGRPDRPRGGHGG